jgi:S-adenosylmethionine-dependent methyltransferase
MLTAFAKGASAYRAYLGSPHGRLRLEVIWHQLTAFLQAAWGREAAPRRVLDVGCGTGELPLRLATQGHAVTLLDPVEEMLRLADESARALASPPAIPPVMVRGSLEEAPGRFAGTPFDLVLCHTVLEYLPEPAKALGPLKELLAPGGYLSLVALNRRQEPFRLAVRDGDLEGARRALAGDGPPDAVFGLPRSGLVRERLSAECAGAGISVLACVGVLVFADCLPARALEEPPTRETLLRLELEAAARAPFGDVGRYLHLWGRRA